MNIQLTPEEFQNVIICFLLDSSSNYDQITKKSESFFNLEKWFKNSGLKSRLLKEYLDMNLQERRPYSLFKDVFYRDTNSMYTLSIRQKDNPYQNTSPTKKTSQKDDWERKIKDTVSKVVKKVVKEAKLYKYTHSMPLTEEKLENLIQKRVNEELQNNLLLEENEEWEN